MRIFNNPLSQSTRISPIPPSTLHIWVYEEDEEAVTTIAAFRNSHIIRIYMLINPCTKEVLCNDHGFDITTLPHVAPSWLCQDYH
jgi:murein endopeptidase